MPQPGSSQAYDRYAYSNNNPINYIDPSGHFAIPVIAVAMIVFAVLGGSYGYGSQVYSNYQYYGYSGSEAWTENISAYPIINAAIMAPAIPLLAPEMLAGTGYGLYSAGKAVSTTPVFSNFSTPLAKAGINTFAASNFTSSFLASNVSIIKPSTNVTNTQITIGTDFVGQSKGPSIAIPNGATGPLPVVNGKGCQYNGGVGGGNGLNTNVTGVRIMDPTISKGLIPGYPNGYVVYMNKYGLTINPINGQQIPPNNYWAHLPR